MEYENIIGSNRTCISETAQQHRQLTKQKKVYVKITNNDNLGH